MKLFVKHILFLFLLINGLFVYGQEEENTDNYYGEMIEMRKFDKVNWEKTIGDINYGKEKSKEEKAEDYDEEFDINEGNDQSRRSYSGAFGGSGFWSAFMKFLMIGILVFVIAVLLVNIIGKGNILKPSGKRISADVSNFSLEQVEEKLYESDLDGFIREAVEKGNYALAIRLYYLAVIKELSLSKVIKWKRDKTNRDYLREMASSALHQPFKEATRAFEHIWYGEHALQKEEYDRLKPRFADLVNQAKAIIPTTPSNQENG